ncbi:ornithine cyclodeaminase family protein [Pseudaestuariivita rosea]|uniref:ornithine cyclodeaminase family protein n=1 Tax=Pseudaestuariivita rosea TaxID=2763263 RepID=UPI001ABAAE13|nr:ornithine cyclodeaminase family protein [Pseudaestuariivita rosea]
MIPFFGPEDIRPYLDIESLIPTAEAAFRAISDSTAQAPVYVLHPNDLADIHVKAATLTDCPILTVKMAGWSQVLADRGAPASSGLIAVFDSETCKPLAILQDDHLISDYRTAAAGALVVKLLAPEDATSALIVGTGAQARLQAEALMFVRPIKYLSIWGRSAAKVTAMVRDLQLAFPAVDIRGMDNLPAAINRAQIILTATGAKEPVIRAEWIKRGQHITSVGSDDTTKCEIDPAILKDADVYVDAIESAVEYGAPSRAIGKGLIKKADLTEIGLLIGSLAKSHANTTVACLSGLGVQDLTAVNRFWDKLIRSR